MCIRSTSGTIAALAVAAALTLAACGGTEDEPDPEPPAATTDTPEPEPDPTEDQDETDEPDLDTGPDDGEESATEGVPPVPDSELPGEETMTYFHEEGTEADVVGVEHDDVLFVRALPDATSEEVGRLAPTAEVTLAGRERNVEHGLWTEIQLADGVGWVNISYLGYLGAATDVTDRFAEVPPAADATEIASGVGIRAAEEAGGEGGPEVTWVLSHTPQDDNLEYAVDVLGIPDDAQFGERLLVTVASPGEGFELEAVTSTQICGRGVTDEELCL